MQNLTKCRLQKPGKGYAIAQKIIVLLCPLLALVPVTRCLGQTLTVSSTRPEKGALITFTYDPRGGKFEHDTLKTANVIITDGFDQLSKKAELVKDGDVYRGKFLADSSTLLIAFAFSFNKIWDNAPKEGHLYPVYENGQPVEGALAAMADFYISKSMKTVFGQEPDYERALELLKQEIKLHPGGKTNFTSLQKYYKVLYKLAPAKAEAEILAHIKAINLQQPASDTEQYKKYRLYEILDLKTEMENTLEFITKQFPNSPVIFSKRYKDALTPRAAADMESIANKLIADYNMVEGTQFYSLRNTVYSTLGQAYLKARNLPKFYFYINAITEPSVRLQDLASAASFLAEGKRELAEAAKISLWGLALADTLTAGKALMSPQMLKAKKTELTGLLGRIYYEEGQLDNAYNLLKTAYDGNTGKLPFIATYYGLALVKKMEYNTARPLLEEAIKLGSTDDEVLSAFKEAFINGGGNEPDYLAHLARLKDDAALSRKLEIDKVMQKTPAPNFTLVDNKGKRVSLADYKGKIVVLDFWATWCVPCLEAFPGMDKLIKKYKNDKDVVFLFINTSETFTRDLPKRVNTYLKEKGFNFHVLFDEKGRIDGVNGYIANKLYGISAIPLKVVVDKEGNIRFKSTGYLGSDEKVVEELSGFIETAKLIN